MDVPSDDGFKWFGEGFDGFPKRLPDDCVEYVLYVVDKQLKDVAALRTRLNQILKTAKDLKKDLLKDYIWQRESFDFKLENGNVAGTLGPDATKLPHLKGSINFGDSIADEWLTVYLLLELSKKCPDAWIRVYDTDGEFLLIEAANALPKWLNPDTANNRVWISNGHLRLIPITPGSQSKDLSLQDALQFVLEKQSKLLISPFVEDEAFHRLKDYPAAISNSLHHALVTLPRNLAYLLHTRPATVSPATEAFYLRDPIALKPLATKTPSKLTFPPTDLVTTSVTFTKVGYAQLQGQIFPPPTAWTTNLSTRNLDYDVPRVSVGMKLTCGFEMLLRDPQNRDKAVVRELEVLLSDLSSGEESLPADEAMKAWPQTQDDDSWLDINYEDFENELSGDKNRKSNSTPKANAKPETENTGEGKAQENLRNMVSRFESFMNDEDAGIDGADDFNHSDDDDSDDDDNDSIDSSGEDKSASYTDAEFEQAMREMMGMPAEEKEARGLVAEARKLALEDEEAGESEDGEEDEDQEMKKVMEAMERELKDRGALRSSESKTKTTADSKDAGSEATPAAQKPRFGPPRPPGVTPEMVLPASTTGTRTSKGKAKVSFADDDDDGDEDSEVESLPEDLYGMGDHELSSDEEDHNDVDLNFAKNMLEGLKGQAGLQGPAGNLMRALGVSMPRDEGDRVKALEGGSSRGKGRGTGSGKGVVNEDGVRRLR